MCLSLRAWRVRLLHDFSLDHRFCLLIEGRLLHDRIDVTCESMALHGLKDRARRGAGHLGKLQRLERHERIDQLDAWRTAYIHRVAVLHRIDGLAVDLPTVRGAVREQNRDGATGAGVDESDIALPISRSVARVKTSSGTSQIPGGCLSPPK